MAETPWEHAAEARAALNAIVSDPQHGVGALSSAQTMSNLLKDLLPDAPREKSILVAAAEAGLAVTLREHVADGMDPATAVRLTASTFSTTTPYPPAACDWAAIEIAIAMGIGKDSGTAPGGQAGFGPADQAGPGLASPHQVTTQAIPGLADYQPARPPPWPGAAAQGFPQVASFDSGQPAGAGSVQPLLFPPPQAGAFPPPQAGAFPPPQAGAFPPVPTGFGPAQPGVFPQPDPRFAGIGPIYPRPKNNGLAVAALLCGIGQFLGWFIFLLPGLVAALLALIFGLVSIRQMRRTGEAGRGMAVTGVELGGLGSLGGISLIVLATVGALS